ncbi:hypothetical protein [Kribbella alba]|uniref:hypothetical protein n=1 Tax=Kribbella alba TaxID=190197 RepID=UPI0031D99579
MRARAVRGARRGDHDWQSARDPHALFAGHDGGTRLVTAIAEQADFKSGRLERVP